MTQENELQLDEAGRRRAAIFFPHSTARALEVFNSGRRFVHYTSAEAAFAILKDEGVWLRSTTVMNDFSEVEHGLQCLAFAWRESPEGERLKTALESIFPGICEEVTTLFDVWQSDLRSNTYILSMSEHLDEEDEHGRLSMWRAYGGRNGVALVVNTTPFQVTTDELGAYSSPVEYLDKMSFAARMGINADRIREDAEFVCNLGRADVANSLFHIFRYAALCTKHPGFAEEREWRIIYSPRLHASSAIKPVVAPVRGVPQIVQRIPLRSAPEEGLYGTSIPELLNRVIIGPSEDQFAVYQALSHVLGSIGLVDAGSKIVMSGIPLRHS